MKLIFFSIISLILTCNAQAWTRDIGIKITKDSAQVKVTIVSGLPEENQKDISIPQACEIIKKIQGSHSIVVVGINAKKVRLDEYISLVEAISKNAGLSLTFIEGDTYYPFAEGIRINLKINKVSDPSQIAETEFENQWMKVAALKNFIELSASEQEINLRSETEKLDLLKRRFDSAVKENPSESTNRIDRTLAEIREPLSPHATAISPNKLSILVDPVQTKVFQAFLEKKGVSFFPSAGKVLVQKSGYLDKESKPQFTSQSTLREIVVQGTMKDFENWMSTWPPKP